MWAAIDIGSNTVQMLIARADNHRLTDCRHFLRTTRLGAGSGGCLPAAAISATAAVIRDYWDELTACGVRQVRILATSAVRDALNRGELLSAIAAAAPAAPPVEILSGGQEARLSFLGARVSLAAPRHWPVADQGGSSTELIYDLAGQLEAVSVNVGAVRAKVNGWSRSEIKQLLAQGLRKRNDADTIVGVGGTITTAAGVLAGLTEYRREAIEGRELVYQDLEQMRQSLLPLTCAERCACSPLLHKRGDIIEQGLDIWLSLLEILEVGKIKVCGGGLLDGALAEMTEVKECN